MKKAIVITTINGETDAIRKWKTIDGYHVVIIGDRKSIPIESSEKLIYLSLKDQEKLGFQLVDSFPVDHYARKNIGYLYAALNGAEVIFETDDDNFPLENWEQPDFSCNTTLQSVNRYLNVYKVFSPQKIWPRGYPLDELNTHDVREAHENTPLQIGVWQGLVDGDPDVDALYRLICAEGTHAFEQRSPAALAKGAYCPFNSQNTFWQQQAYTYLYLPVTVSFRFTDILRGYIAQRLIWQQGMHLGFLSSNARQLRNEHDLMRDFEQEIECYLHVKPVIKALEELNLTTDSGENLWQVYTRLVDDKLVKKEELHYLKMWLEDLRSIGLLPS